MDKTVIDRTLSSKPGEQAYAVCEALTDAGHEAWFVGGCVRDMLLGELPHEIDIATDALPETVKKLFPKNDTKGEVFGSIIVSLKGEEFEVTTFREDDSASDGRHPESVHFGTRENDAKRRDITVNALYWNPISREVFDPFDGQKDLEEKLVRVIGNPEERIEHDALRLLRVIRFRARLGGQYEPQTYQALHKKAKNISLLSGTRCFEELQKILMGPNPDVAFEDLWETDILETLIPELHSCRGVAQPADYHKEGDVWEHLMQCIRSYTDDHGIDVRIAALFHDIGKVETFSIKERIRFDEHAPVSAKIVEKILARFQVSTKRTQKICWLIEHHMMMGFFEKMEPDRKAHWYYHPWFVELLQLFWLDVAGTTPSDFRLYEAIVDDYNHYLDAQPRPAKALLTGEEIMEILGIAPGEKVGSILKSLHDAQTKKEVTTKKEAKEFLANYKAN